MNNSIRNQTQSRTIGEIASILHMKRKGVADLISRSDNPLPLPHHAAGSDHFIVDSAYRHKLLCWVQKEKVRRAKGNVELMDYQLVERELRAGTRRRATFSIEEQIDENLPGVI